MWTRIQPSFTTVHSRNRFKQIFWCIRFDNRTIWQQRKEVSIDPIESLRFIYDEFINNCLGNYSPSSNVTVDDRLAIFSGKCPFRLYKNSYQDIMVSNYGLVWNNKRGVNQGQRDVLYIVRPTLVHGEELVVELFCPHLSSRRKKAVVKRNAANE